MRRAVRIFPSTPYPPPQVLGKATAQQTVERAPTVLRVRASSVRTTFDALVQVCPVHRVIGVDPRVLGMVLRVLGVVPRVLGVVAGGTLKHPK